MASNLDLSDFPLGFDPGKYKKDIEELGGEVADALRAGYLKSLRKSDTETNRAFQEKYQALKTQLDFGLITQEEYFTKLEQIRDTYYAKDTQEWYNYTGEIYNYKVKMLKDYEQAVEDNLAEIAKREADAVAYLQECLDDFSKNSLSNFSEIAKEAENMLEKIGSARDAFSDKLYDYAGTGVGFDTHTTKIHNYYETGDPLVITDYTLSDLDAGILKLKEFNDTIEKLKDRADEIGSESFRGFFEELRTLSVEDAKILADLLLSTDEETFADYLAAFEEKKALSDEIADFFYQEDFANAASEIKQAVEAEFSDIPADFFSIGELTAENFKDGFLSQIDTLFSDVADTLEQEGLMFSPSYNTNPENNTFAPTYNLYQVGETVSQQLISARNHTILEQLREGLGK